LIIKIIVYYVIYMNNFTIVNIPMKPIYDNTSLLPLYQVNNPIYVETTHTQKQNQVNYPTRTQCENNC
jgi:hypothetical protein